VTELAHRFNHDLCLTPTDRDAALTQWPTLNGLVPDERFVETFHELEIAAAFYKILVQRAGSIAVCLAAASLSGCVLDLAKFPWAHRLVPVLGVFGAGSFVCAFLASRFWRWRRRWLTARFSTEYLRAWHFDLLIRTAVSRGSQEGPLSRRGSELSAQLAELRNSAAAMMDRFTQGGPILSRTTPAPVGRGQIDCNVLEAFAELRLKHQLRYVTYKLSPDDQTFAGLSMALLDSASNTIAAWTLTGSVLLAIASAIVPAFVDGRGAIAAATLVLIVLAAAIRAWRGGFGIERQTENYRDYERLLTQLQTRWNSGSDTQKIAIAYEVESAAHEELRGFLRIHDEAQFIF